MYIIFTILTIVAKILYRFLSMLLINVALNFYTILFNKNILPSYRLAFYSLGNNRSKTYTLVDDRGTLA